MKKSAFLLCLLFLFCLSLNEDVLCQRGGLAIPAPKTVLSEKLMNTLINEISGELPFNNIMETGGYNRDRKKEEYEGLYWETEYFLSKAKEYGFTDAHVEHFEPFAIPMMGGSKQWDAEVGELWLVEPEERLIINQRDIPFALAGGSKTADVTSELVYVGKGTKDSDYEGKEVEGKIIFVDGSPNSGVRLGVGKYGAVGVVGFSNPREYTHADQIPQARIMAPRNAEAADNLFAFQLSFRLGMELKGKLERGQKLVVRAKVKTTEYETDEEVTTAIIPGDGSTDQEVVFVAHIFEGVTKQGAADNKSGGATIMEVGRTLIKLIEEGKIARPKRTMRFLWVPEITGTFQYLQKYPGEAKKMIATINMDMVGEHQTRNMSNLRMHRSLYSHTNFLSDINEDFFYYVGETNREIAANRGATKYTNPIIAPSGSREQFYYGIEKNYSASDHIVFMTPTFKIPAIIYNNWPDLVYHTSEDRPYACDPTQLKRAAFLGAATGYAIANATADDVPRLMAMLKGKSLERIGREVKRAVYMVEMSTGENVAGNYKDAQTVINCTYDTEKQNLNSLKTFAGDDGSAHDFIKAGISSLNSTKESHMKLLKSFYELQCKKLGVPAAKPELTEDEVTAQKMVPEMVPSEGGLMSIFMAMMERGKISGDAAIECLNYVDGKRSLLDIRNLVCTEFTFLPVKDYISHFNRLEKSKNIKFK